MTRPSSWMLTAIATASALYLCLSYLSIKGQQPENDGLFLQTTRLRIDHNGDGVETDAALVLRAGSWQFSATGMRANLGRQRLELLAQVRGIHE